MIPKKAKGRPKQVSILQSLNIFGIDNLTENFILSSILTGDPCMMIGKPGSAKTEIVKVIGQALNSSDRRAEIANPFSFQIYDASKLSFEDLVGYPDPKSLMNGDTISFIKTPLTIWNKTLVGFDEINRCSPEVQNNLFELIRSRKCNGIDTNTKFIFGTMNPFGSVATTNLAGALVDRFTFFLIFPDFSTFNADDKMSVINRIGDVDSVGLRIWRPKAEYTLDFSFNQINDTLADVGDTIKNVLNHAGKTYDSVAMEFGESFSRMIIKLDEEIFRAFAGEKPAILDEVKISGRRAGMIKRALIACKSMEAALHDTLHWNVISCEAMLKKVFEKTIPLGIATAIPEALIKKLHVCIRDCVDNNWKLIHGAEATPEIKALIHSNNILEKLAILSNPELEVDGIVLSSIWKTFKESNDVTEISIIHYFGKLFPTRTTLNISVNSFIPSQDLLGKDYNILQPQSEELQNLIIGLQKTNYDNNDLRYLCSYFICLLPKFNTEESLNLAMGYISTIINNLPEDIKKSNSETKEELNFLDSIFSLKSKGMKSADQTSIQYSL